MRVSYGISTEHLNYSQRGKMDLKLSLCHYLINTQCIPNPYHLSTLFQLMLRLRASRMYDSISLKLASSKEF